MVSHVNFFMSVPVAANGAAVNVYRHSAAGNAFMSAPIYHLIPNAPKPVVPYSHVVKADGWLLVTGQLATDPDDGSLPLRKGSRRRPAK